MSPPDVDLIPLRIEGIRLAHWGNHLATYAGTDATRLIARTLYDQETPVTAIIIVRKLDYGPRGISGRHQANTGFTHPPETLVGFHKRGRYVRQNAHGQTCNDDLLCGKPLQERAASQSDNET